MRKKYKRIIVWMAFILLLLPIGNIKAFADIPSGELRGKTVVNSSSIAGGTSYTNLPTDGDPTTGIAISPFNYHWSALTTTLTISQYYINVSSTSGLKLVLYDANNSVLKTVTNLVNKSITDITPVTSVKKVALYNDSGYMITDYEFDVYRQTNYSDVSNLGTTVNKNSITLKYDLPLESPEFNGTKIYRNGVLITTQNSSANQYIDSNLNYESTYIYKVTAIYKNGFETTGKVITATTEVEPKPVGEVTDLTADSTETSVELSFVKPVTNKLKTINIYRNGEKIGSTNNNKFIDSTVIPSTSYQYTVKTVSIYDLESNGVIIGATTKNEVPPQIDGASFEAGQKGNYIVSWTAPTTGTIRIFVGGNLYKEVNADLKTYTIGAESMKYTALGDPDVRLQPVSIFGTEGNSVQSPTTISQTKVPFTPENLIETANSLLWYVGPLILLALSLLLVPKFRKAIFNAIGRNKNDPGDSKGRRSQAEGKASKDPLIKEEKQEREPKEKRVRDEKDIKTKSIRETRISRMRAEKPKRIKREPRQIREPRKQNRKPRESRQERGMN